MLQLIPVKHSADLNSDFRLIYEEGFPPDERREWNQLKDLLASSDFCLNRIYHQQKLIGLLSVWNLNSFSFIEHFTIRKTERGKGFGTEAIQQILARVKSPVILEVEGPLTDSARKRIAFYEHLKFSVSTGVYYQPPYSVGKKEVKMVLMSFPEQIQPNDFNKIKSEIHQSVYSWYHDSD